MFNSWFIILISFAYLAILFAIAYYGDKRASRQRSLINNPYIYTLTIATYCTAWTFYGSVGRATSVGLGFLSVYLGPTLMAFLWWLVLHKIVRIAKTYHITSIADFISSRYGKSTFLGGLVALIAVISIMPYISLQLKAISMSFSVIHQASYSLDIVSSDFWLDTTFYIALLLAFFTILFGTRHIDTTEKHEGMVTTIAFESLIKLIAFISIGVFVTFVLFEGPNDLFTQAFALPELNRLMDMNHLKGSYVSWLTLILLSMLAVLFLPRQFQVLVIENVDEKHIKTASWLFPLYLFLITLFALPIAYGGYLLLSPQQIAPDIYTLVLPLEANMRVLALLVYIGGFSAATSMVIVETIVLATMVCNDLVMPLLLRIKSLRLLEQQNLTGLLLTIRRIAILFILLLGYFYFRTISASPNIGLVSIGLTSFVAVAQFGPPILIGLYWKGASRTGAIVGLIAGFSLWLYTLLLPNFAMSGWLPSQFIETGLLGLEWLKPQALFGLTDLNPVTHAVFWSLLANIGCLVGISLFSRQTTVEQLQATAFVDIFDTDKQSDEAYYLNSRVDIEALQTLLVRFLGAKQVEQAFQPYVRARYLDLEGKKEVVEPQILQFSERLLAGAIGTASAHIILVTTTIKDKKTISIDGLMGIVNETSQIREYSRHLEQKSQALENENLRLNAELDVACRLQQMLLPSKQALQQIEELDVAGFMEPANEVGGDYYDILQYSGRLLFAIGDVTGHGLESGALAIMIQASVRTLLAHHELEPSQFFHALNQMVFHNIQQMKADKSLTLVLVEYYKNQLYLSGQHEELIVMRQGQLELIDTIDLGFPLGLDKNIAHFVHQTVIPLNPSDVAVFYTDGVTEAENLEGQLYGLERLCHIVQQNWRKTAQQIQEAVIHDVHQFIGKQTVFDDMTLLVLKPK